MGCLVIELKHWVAVGVAPLVLVDVIEPGLLITISWDHNVVTKLVGAFVCYGHLQDVVFGDALCFQFFNE